MIENLFYWWWLRLWLVGVAFLVASDLGHCLVTCLFVLLALFLFLKHHLLRRKKNLEEGWRIGDDVKEAC